MSLRVSDHALLRFMDRGGDMNVEGLRAQLSASLARAHAAARTIGSSQYLIKADGLLFCVVGDTVTTVIEDRTLGDSARALEHPRR